MNINNSDKVYQQVIDYLIIQIRDGKIKKGDKIPTERELTESLGVSRAAIREAIKIFDIIGIVEIIPSQGTYVKKEFDNWIIDPISIVFKLSKTTQKEVHDFRQMIEVEMATLAAEKITDDEINELTICHNEMMKFNEGIEKSRLDKRFHYIIAKATKNHIILNAYNAMSPMLDMFTLDIRAIVLKNEKEGIVDVMHDNIFKSIVNKDKIKSGEFMKVHMEMINKYFGK